MVCVLSIASLAEDSWSYVVLRIKCLLSSNFRVGPETEQCPLNKSGFNGVTNDPFNQYPINGINLQQSTGAMICALKTVLHTVMVGMLVDGGTTAVPTSYNQSSE